MMKILVYDVLRYELLIEQLTEQQENVLINDFCVEKWLSLLSRLTRKIKYVRPQTRMIKKNQLKV